MKIKIVALFGTVMLAPLAFALTITPVQESETRAPSTTNGVPTVTSSEYNASPPLLSGTQSVSLAEAADASFVVTTSVTDSLIVTKPEQPKASIVPAGALRVPFTNITFTTGNTDITINRIEVQRVGLAKNAVFESLLFLDEIGVPISDERFLHSDNKTAFTDSISIPAGESVTLTLAGNMSEDLSEFDGQVPVLQINSIEASAPIESILPIQGVGLTTNATLPIGSASMTLSSYDPGVSTNRYINDTGVRFSGVRLTANSKEDLKLHSIAWEQGGTASDSDIANVSTIVDGVSYPTEVEEKEFISVFPQGILIRKGETVYIHIQGDLLPSGANRTVAFDIAGADDVALVGQMYGFSLAPTAGGNTATEGTSVFIVDDEGESTDPFFAGSVVTINGGTFNSIQKAN